MNPVFIVVDDDSINNTICRKIIGRVIPEATVVAFTDPEEALAYVQTVYSKENAGTAILLLDINMPSLDGWEFLQAFEAFDADLKARFTIYMLSSSVDTRDTERASNNGNVRGYLQKPLSLASVKIVLSNNV